MAINGLRYAAGAFATTSDLASNAGLNLVAVSTFSAASSVSVNNCFNATYNNYLIKFSTTTISANGNLLMRMRVGGTDASGASSYIRQVLLSYSSTVAAATQTDAQWQVGGLSTGTPECAMSMEIFGPFLAVKTNATNRNVQYEGAGSVWQSAADGFNHTQATSYDGFTIYPNTGNITGTIRVYGYKNSI